MSFVFRGSGGDLESGFSGFIPERRAMVCLLLLLHTFSKYINYCVKSDLCWNYYSCIKCLSVQRVHGARPVNSNSLAFLVTGNLHSSFFLHFY